MGPQAGRAQPRGAADAAPAGTRDPAPRRRVEQAEDVIDRPAAGPCPRQADSAGRQDHDVFITLTRAKDEEAVAHVVGYPGYDHGAEQPGGAEHRQEAQPDQQAGADLREARDPGVKDSRIHPQGADPSSRSGDLPAAENVVDAVRQAHSGNGEAENQQPEVYGTVHISPLDVPAAATADRGQPFQTSWSSCAVLMT